ncbi:MAG: DUF4870 domain-containing protein [Gammaproteobacteria bacterium]|uniref:Orotate phosphoribosyltransferase n=1 Tax=Pseudomonas cuatrocienegasensis TaxID=543360 RepID=A0ABY1B6Y2_9PSED|nr:MULTISPECIES: DUF4870 domain-containing protein [Pseudomonas]MBU1330342.1 DUF4870 domain-containing protein [Gammaproteobacteria bacterium]MBU1490086.1 DUF4870 domain-containing protein [Gammaproteobacteria bacterium]MBU2066948.1 DUF4870 domain-containing protein [Gammaproteobacteria bacterium]MBU2139655.1 DUF4870 domain-containing protein [Gammaproteobacteria bacterium]MBU2217757.1 DUF4870 domain-containing protein [Gammaproteobacteria bacterium]
MEEIPHMSEPVPSREARQWAMFCHFAAFLGLIFPFGNLLGPLIVWQVKKDLDPFVDAQGKEALNFQISVALAMVLCFLLMVVLIGFPLLALVGIAALILTVIAGIKANEGRAYRYPFCWRLIK